MKSCCIAIAVSLLLAIGAQAQEPDCGQWDPPTMGLYWEIVTIESVTACLKAGVNLEARNEYGRTALHVAANHTDNPAIIEALIKAGADPNAPDMFGQTPLHRTSFWGGGSAVIETLLKSGADPNARTERGNTPLHLAVSWPKAVIGNPAAIEALLKSGADPNVRNTKGKTPWDLAQDNEMLKGSAAYWKLNDARFRSPQGAAPPQPRPQAKPAAKPAPAQSAGPCEIPGYPKPDNPRSLGLSWCPASVGFQVRAFALTAAGAKCALSHGSTTPDKIQARRKEDRRVLQAAEGPRFTARCRRQVPLSGGVLRGTIKFSAA